MGLIFIPPGANSRDPPVNFAEFEAQLVFYKIPMKPNRLSEDELPNINAVIEYNDLMVQQFLKIASELYDYTIHRAIHRIAVISPARKTKLTTVNEA